MKIKLGYVAIAQTLNLTTSKTITYTNYEKLNENDKKTKLNTIIKENFKNLEQILNYNIKNNIHFYRLSPNIIPLATHPKIKFDYITTYKKDWEKIGNIIKKNKMRVDTHPDHFCVLNSPKKEVINQSIKTLNYNQKIFEAMEINSQTILHIGGLYNNKEKALKNFIKTFKKLDKKIQEMIIIENDDKIFNIKDTLYICEKLKIPMVLDYHHFKCNNDGENIKDFLPRILATWKHKNINPKMHFSSPKNKKEFRHHNEYININDFIKFIEILKPYKKDIDIMLECKAKDEALFKLVRQIKTYTNYEFIDDTTFKI